MPKRGRRLKVPGPNNTQVDGTEVLIDESSEKWSEFTLEDGTVFRGRVSIVSAVRVDDQYDAEGNPLYVLNTTPQIAIISVPDDLKKKAS